MSSPNTIPTWQRHMTCAPGEQARHRRTDEVVSLRGVQTQIPDGSPLLQDVDLQVYQGDFVWVKGQSGSGKSTMHRVMAGIETPTAGEVKLFGKSLPGMRNQNRKKLFRQQIGLGFQKPELKRGWSVVDNMVHHALSSKKMKERKAITQAGAILEQFGLSHRVNARAATLSGGEQQKVALGSLVMTRPDLLLLDEPTSAMDRAAKQRSLEMLQGLAVSEGTTIVMISHDNEDAARFTSRQVTVDQGSIIADIHTPLPSVGALMWPMQQGSL